MTPVKRIPRIPDQPWAFILYVLRHCSRQLKLQAAMGMGCEMAGTVCDVLVTWVLGRIVGVILETGQGDWTPVMYELVLLGGLWTIRSCLFRIREYMDRRYVPELLDTTRNLLFNRLIQQSQSFLHANFAGVLANHVRRAGDVIGSLREKLQHNILPLLVRFITAGYLLWGITPSLTLFVLGFISLCVVSALLTAPRWTRLSVRHADCSSRLSGHIVDSVTNLSIVQQDVGWPEEQLRIARAHEDFGKSYRARMVYGSWFWGTFDTVMTFFFCGFMALVVYAYRTGDVTTGELAMTVGLVTGLFGALANTVSLLSSKFDDIGILKESLQKIATPLGVLDAEDATDLHVTAGRVEFRNVDFEYGNGHKVIEGLSLTIEPGQKLGIVGVSGAGKTTVCQLLLRSYDVTGGGIFIDDQEIGKTKLDSLRRNIAVIPQEPVLFHRTLSENISYGRRDASHEEIVKAAEAAEAAKFISLLPHGYDTMVGERGIKLSGGQRQRIAIARAILKNAPILILDEATSALDSETEKAIQIAMLAAMKGRTTVVIAHRLSTLSHMDRIIVMDKGKIIEDGPFRQLMAANGAFARLWQLQAGGFLPNEQPEPKPEEAEIVLDTAVDAAG